MTVTPMMQQYQRIKNQYPDTLVFFRLGDFYELFGEDAKIASKVLEITLTTRDRNAETPFLCAGFLIMRSTDIWKNLSVKASKSPFASS